MDSTLPEKLTKGGEVIHEVEREADQSSDTVTIDPEVERRCMRKFDLFVMPQILILLLLGYLDRSNVGKWRPTKPQASLSAPGKALKVEPRPPLFPQATRASWASKPT